MSVGTVPATRRDPQLHARVSPFMLRSDHDLLEQEALAGLADALGGGGHFPGSVRGRRRRRGGAVGDGGVRRRRLRDGVGVGRGHPGGRAPRAARHVVRRVEAVFDRPFGFLTVHRTSSLVLSAGWVSSPVPSA
ncbi:hypothetical protein ACFQ60_44270 [Streptomyces zhihengii]